MFGSDGTGAVKKFWVRATAAASEDLIRLVGLVPKWPSNLALVRDRSSSPAMGMRPQYLAIEVFNVPTTHKQVISESMEGATVRRPSLQVPLSVHPHSKERDMKFCLLPEDCQRICGHILKPPYLGCLLKVRFLIPLQV